MPLSVGISNEQTTRLAMFVGSGVLLVVCALAILYLPFIFSLMLPVALLATIVVIRLPTESLIAIFMGRMTFDLLWFLPAGFGLNFMELFAGGVTILLVLMCLMRIDDVLAHPFLPGIALWATLLLLGAAQQPQARVVAEVLARFLSPMMILLVMSIHFREDKNRRRLVMGLVAAGFLPIVVGLFHWLTGQASSYQLGGYDRLNGGYMNIADHGLAMGTFTMVAMVWLWHTRRRWKMAALVGYIVCCFFLLILTYTRTPLLGLLTFIFAFLFLHGNRRILTIALVVAAVVMATNGVVQDRFSDFTDFFTVDAGYRFDQLGSGRLGIWRRSIEAFLNQPFLQILVGNGLRSQYLLADGQDSHSDYISLLLQVGPIGLFIWVGFQFEVARRAYRELAMQDDPWTRTLLIAIISLAACIFICNTFTNAYVSRVTVSWFWFGMAGLVFAIQKERQMALPEASQHT